MQNSIEKNDANNLKLLYSYDKYGRIKGEIMEDNAYTYIRGTELIGFTSNNEKCPEHWYQAEMEPQLEEQLYEGGNTEGWIAIQIKKDDLAPKLAYGLDYNG